jgi:hypothetical protein
MILTAHPLRLLPATMLQIWERGGAWHPIDQALLVLQTTDPVKQVDELATWTVGQRDRRLIEIRQATFGDHIAGYAECPSCRSGVEFELSCRRLIEQDGETESVSQRILHDGRQWELRAPNSRDLSRAASASDPARARLSLWTSCVRSIDETGTSDDNPTDSYDSVLLNKLAALDPLAEILIGLTCSSCGHIWQSLFDIVTFLWREIRTSSRRLLQDIDALARTYGWTEGEVLGLSDQRRRLYVQMALS